MARLEDEATAIRVIDFLNDLLKKDRPAIAALIANRVPCSHHLANDRYVQVTEQHGGYHVGLLGLLNGLCGVRHDNTGLIQAVFDDGNLIRFELTRKRETIEC